MCATNFRSDSTALTEIVKRAGGRRRYNAERQEARIARRLTITRVAGGMVILNPHGIQTRLAGILKVNRSTICRDIEAIREEWRHHHICRYCVSYSPFPLRIHAKLYQLQRRRDPGLEMDCCVAGFLGRENARKKKRVTDLEREFRQAVENL